MHTAHEVKIIETPTARISLDSDGIVHVMYISNSDIDIKDKKEHHEAFQKLTGGVKHPFLIKAGTNVTFTKEARDYGSKMEPLQPFLSFAIVANTTAYRLLANFYFQFHKPAMPYKVFRNEQDALKWLKENFCRKS